MAEQKNWFVEKYKQIVPKKGQEIITGAAPGAVEVTAGPSTVRFVSEFGGGIPIYPTEEEMEKMDDLFTSGYINEKQYESFLKGVGKGKKSPYGEDIKKAAIRMAGDIANIATTLFPPAKIVKAKALILGPKTSVLGTPLKMGVTGEKVAKAPIGLRPDNPFKDYLLAQRRQIAWGAPIGATIGGVMAGTPVGEKTVEFLDSDNPLSYWAEGALLGLTLPGAYQSIKRGFGKPTAGMYKGYTTNIGELPTTNPWRVDMSPQAIPMTKAAVLPAITGKIIDEINTVNEGVRIAKSEVKNLNNKISDLTKAQSILAPNSPEWIANNAQLSSLKQSLNKQNEIIKGAESTLKLSDPELALMAKEAREEATFRSMAKTNPALENIIKGYDKRVNNALGEYGKLVFGDDINLGNKGKNFVSSFDNYVDGVAEKYRQYMPKNVRDKNIGKRAQAGVEIEMEKLGMKQNPKTGDWIVSDKIPANMNAQRMLLKLYRMVGEVDSTDGLLKVRKNFSDTFKQYFDPAKGDAGKIMRQGRDAVTAAIEMNLPPAEIANFRKANAVWAEMAGLRDDIAKVLNASDDSIPNLLTKLDTDELGRLRQALGGNIIDDLAQTWLFQGAIDVDGNVNTGLINKRLDALKQKGSDKFRQLLNAKKETEIRDYMKKELAS